MMCRTFSSQRGFSLLKFILFLAVILGFVIVTLALLPDLRGKVLDIINQLSEQARSILKTAWAKIAAPLNKGVDWVARKIDDFKDWWYCYKNPDKCESRSLGWFQDMYLLIQLAEDQDYDMSNVRSLLDLYEQGKASARRVETKFWEELQNQTADAIEKNISRLRKRLLGCSDFTDELIKIWEIEQNFNAETLEGYFVAKFVSNQLHDPRSTEFAQDLFGWLGYENTKWFMEQLVLAIPPGDQTADYPAILQKIDERIQQSSNPLERVVGNITAAEIYLNYELIVPAENRYDQALRYLAEIGRQYGHTMSQERQIGLHMSLALLNERVCKNDDLAIKEFKDALAIARRQGLKCELYNDAHYHLGIINLYLRDPKTETEEKGSKNDETTEELYSTTPTPAPTPTPIPTPTPNPIKIIVEIPTWRSLRPPETETGATTRSIGGQDIDMKVVKGEILVPRNVRLRPRQELGKESQLKMKTFKLDSLYDLDNIPDSAIRELELFLRCSTSGPRVDIARYIHEKYMESRTN